jgi:hypothetical protein
MSNWTELAKKEFPSVRRILGHGKYAVATPDGTVCYLAVSEQQARSIALGIERPIFKNLTPIDFDHIPDLEDADECRKRRREEARANQ